MTTEHTPLPWNATPAAGGHQIIIWNENGKTVALVYTDAIDAALITRAVNSHAALVEALERIAATIPNIGSERDFISRVDIARAALKLAKES